MQNAGLCVCVCVCVNSISDPRYVHSVWKDDQVAGCYSKSCIGLVESEIQLDSVG